MVTKALINQVAPKSLKKKKTKQNHVSHPRELPCGGFAARGGDGHRPTPVGWMDACWHRALSPQGLQGLALIIINGPRLQI